MNVLETREKRLFAPNVKMISRSIFERVLTLLFQGISLGVVLFVALTTLSLLKQSSGLPGSVSKEKFTGPQEPRNLTVPRVDRAPVYAPVRPAVVLQKQGTDYRVTESQYRFLSDLSGNVSRVMERFVK